MANAKSDSFVIKVIVNAKTDLITSALSENFFIELIANVKIYLSNRRDHQDFCQGIDSAKSTGNKIISLFDITIMS